MKVTVDDWRLYSPYFRREEFACPCCGVVAMNVEFMDGLFTMRQKMGRPFDINSGLRCHAHNASVGGAPRSAHLVGRAADIQVNDGEFLWHVIRLAERVNMTGIGISHGHQFVHLDNQPDSAEGVYRPRAWTYA